MAAPTNISALTATDLGTLPASVTQNVHDAGTTYTVWYRYTAVAGDNVLGLFGFGDLAVYTPTIAVFVGPAAAPVSLLSISAVNRPVQFPVTAGETYYFSFTTNGGNPSPASLAITLQNHADEATVPIGSIAINDDEPGFPIAFLPVADGDDFHILSYRQNFPASGDIGDVLNSGLVLIEDDDDEDLKLINSSYDLVTTVPFYGALARPRIKASLPNNKWYVAAIISSVGQVRTVEPDGAFGPDTWSVVDTTITGGIAASNDESILYHAGINNAMAVERHDLATDTPLSDLVAGIANYSIREILVCEDDTVLVLYWKSTVTRDTKVIHYATDGSVLDTYNFGTYGTTSPPRMAINNDDLSFWVWLWSNPGEFKFVHTRISDGATLATVLQAEFQQGEYRGAATATPPADFGNSNSCPFWITRTGFTPEPEPIPPDFEIEEDPIRWLRRSPIQASEQRNVFWDLFRLEIDPGVGLQSGDDQDTDPQIMMRMSFDNGKTWGNELWRSMGRVGKWNTRLDWWRLGKGPNAVIEVSGSAAVHTVLIDGYAQVSPSTDSPTS